MTLWVYADAKKRSPQSAVLWALVAFFGGILGLLLYLLLGRGGQSRNTPSRGRSPRAWSHDADDDDDDALPPSQRAPLSGNDRY